MRNSRLSPADACLGELRQSNQEVALRPGIICPPPRAVRLPAHARVEHVASGEIAIGPVVRWQFRRIALFAAQDTEAAIDILPELRERVGG